MQTLILRWREDPAGTYRSWFLWEERLKNFRSIRRGLMAVVEAIGAGTFGPGDAARALFLVAPDERENEVRTQLRRPAFQRIGGLRVRYLPYGELERNREAMARFGQGLKAIEAVARDLI